MKIKEGYLLRDVAGNSVVVPVGKATMDFNGMFTLNGTGSFLWKNLIEDTTAEKLALLLQDTYHIDESTAKRDISLFLEKLEGEHLLE